MSGGPTDFLKRTNVKTFFGDAKFPPMVAKARNLLKSCPPENFLSKWPKLSDEDFRLNLSDNDAVVTMSIAITAAGGKNIPLYWCDNWELLYENLLLHEKHSVALTDAPTVIEKPVVKTI